MKFECWKKLLNKLQEGKDDFDYFILDSHLGNGIDGFSVAEAIKANPKYERSVVIMMLSSTAQRGTLEKHSNLLVSVFLTKPLGQTELLMALMKPYYTPQTSQSQVPPTVQAPQPAPERPKLHAKILLAEDNVVNQRLAIRMLEKLGYTVTLAENGLKAVKAVEQSEYDLILMDVQMPGKLLLLQNFWLKILLVIWY